MKYYIGYYNEPWDKSKFTVICGCPNKWAATFILSKYEEAGHKDTYEILTAAEAMDKKLIF